MRRHLELVGLGGSRCAGGETVDIQLRVTGRDRPADPEHLRLAYQRSHVALDVAAFIRGCLVRENVLEPERRSCSSPREGDLRELGCQLLDRGPVL